MAGGVAACGACLEPAAPCLFGWMTCCWDGRVIWRASEAGRWLCALTIDDVPRAATTASDVRRLMTLLAQSNAKATFFLIFEQLTAASEDVRRVFMEQVRAYGHEVGLHFKGRWGHTMGVEELKQGACQAQHFLQRRYNLTLRYARMPGGFSTPAQVTALEQLGLTVVNGTGYPFDADLCACLPAWALGRCAARLTARGGRIAILHDSDKLYREVDAFLRAARDENGHTVVTLGELLEQTQTSPERGESGATACEMPQYPLVAL